MKQLSSVALLLVFAAAAPAQDITIPTEIKGKVGEFLKVPAATQGAVVRWRAVDAGLNLFPVELLKDTRTAVVVAIQPGKYRLWAWTALNGAPTEAAETLVIVEGPTPPPHPPNPPGPVDSFAQALRDAYTKEGTGRDKLPRLIGCCQTMAEITRVTRSTTVLTDVKTVRDAWAKMIAEDVAPALPHVRGVIVRHLDAKLPVTAVPLTPELRTTIADTFDYLATSLEKINP